RIDILKVDVEGVEVEVLTSLADLLPEVKVLYVEYDSRTARRAIAELFENTHELYCGVNFLDQGECIYLRRDLAALPAATERLRELLGLLPADAQPPTPPAPPKTFEIEVDDGGTVPFACAGDLLSRWVHGDILGGKTYPHLPFVSDVQVVFDVGANCGAASVY